jgi:hypothetical protein
MLEEPDDPRELQAREEEKFLEQHPEEQIFKQVLDEALLFKSYPDSSQSTFDLNNQVRPHIRPLIRLLMHEFQEYLHQPAEIDLETVINSVCEL